MMKRYKWLVVCWLAAGMAAAQPKDKTADVEMVSAIMGDALTRGSGYEWLRFLCKGIGGRIAGSPEGAAAEVYTAQMLDTIGVDSVWMQPVEVNYWRRGAVERAKVLGSATMGDVSLSVAALGFSAATPALGIVGNVLEVKTLEELERLGKEKVKGKIVFFNRPMDATKVNTFHAYGQAGDQRTQGPRKAAELGAIGVVVRSMTLRHDDVPHSGVTIFNDVPPIPAVGMGLESADLLSTLLNKEPNLRLHLQLDCAHLGKQKANNVIGELRGSKYPEEIIVIGGHLDSWDIGEGAHDDGAGCVQAMQVLQIFKHLGIRPQRTIRCVLFANEENGMMGATQYAAEAKRKGERHLAALESDGGGHAPRGFSMDALEDILPKSYERAQEWRALLSPYGFYELETGGSGADVSKLKAQGTILFGYRADSQRYFDYHHSRNDVFEHVHQRELELGAGGIAAWIYLIDKYGFK